LPYAFTEQGVAMLSSVLHSERAARVNVGIMRAFVKLREMILSSEEFSRKLHAAEDKLQKHTARFKKQGRQIKIIFDTIYELMNAPRAAIGFKPT
jgi:biotin operon repressor